MEETTGTIPPQDNLNAAEAFPILVSLRQKQLACAPQNTTYNVTFYSAGNIQTVVPPYEFTWEGLPALSQPYEHSFIHVALANILNGMIGKMSTRPGGDQQSSVTTWEVNFRTSIMQTALIGALDVYESLSQEDKMLARNMSIGPLIEELSRNLTLSLFSNPHFW